MIDTTTDFSAAMADFGTAGTLNGETVIGIFDNGYAEGMDTVAGRRPFFAVPDTAAPAVDSGDTLVLGAASYRVVGVEPDGTGMTRLMLERR